MSLTEQPISAAVLIYLVGETKVCGSCDTLYSRILVCDTGRGIQGKALVYGTLADSNGVHIEQTYNHADARATLVMTCGRSRRQGDRRSRVQSYYCRRQSASETLVMDN